MSLPPEFRAKHDHLLNVVDSRTGKPVTDSLGVAHRLEPHPSGGARFGFSGGGLYSFDHTGRYPVVAVWGKIFRYYATLGSYDGGFGRPLTDVTDLRDGGRCCIFEGGHLHEYGEKVEPFPASHCMAEYQPQVPPFPFGIGPGGMPFAFHQKWISLSLQKDPNGESMDIHLGLPTIKLRENSNGGQYFRFLGGFLVTLDNNSPPVVCYGVFSSLWERVGGVIGGLGHPLADPQVIEGGRCQIFKGGHIHQIEDSVHTCSPNQCPLGDRQPRSLSWNTMPPHFQRKWTALCSVIHPHTREPIAEMLGAPCYLLADNPKNLGGQHFHFLGSHLVSLSMNPDATPFSKPPMASNAPSYSSSPNTYGGYPQSSQAGYNMMPLATGYGSPSHPVDDNFSPYGLPAPSYNAGYPGRPQYIPGLASHGEARPLVLTEPFYVTGVISSFWREAGGLESTYGRPLCDEQDLPDGGRCGIFEGAHIHLYKGEARGVPAQHCTAPYQPTAPPRHDLTAWPSQPAGQPPMGISQMQTGPQSVDPKPTGGCMALLKLLCACHIVADGRGGVCKCGDCVCCTWSVS